MHITLVIPTLNRYDRLETMLATVVASTVAPDQTIVIDNGRQLLSEPWMAEHKWINVFTPPRNLGVAGSCNQALRMSRDWWFHCNDDVELAPDLIEKMKAAILSEQEFLASHSDILCEKDESQMFIPDYGLGSAFSVFMMQKSITARIGWWDENFFPIYFEDNDYGYRMNLARVKRKVVEGCSYLHHTSSSVSGMSPDDQSVHHRNFKKLRNYYTAKWGGIPEQETYSRPFDGGSLIEVDRQWWSRFGREEG